ncbi:MAG: electron transfer flavoprotein subunit alpha/FixB family protein [Bacteroidetes bacterium]|nr:electron transfer flavoprotein subunit alpha/FixB family protein [Bacteroidota bacterium]
MGYVWTLAEQYEGHLKEVSYELLFRGRTLADRLGIKLASLVMGNGLSQGELEKLIKKGADVVYCVADPRVENYVCETYANTIAALIQEYQPHIILAAATSMGRSLMPYIAVKVHTGLTADCTELAIEEGTRNLLQTRPAIGGNIMATIKTPEYRPQMATVRPKSSYTLPEDPDREGEIVQIPFCPDWFDGRVEVLGCRKDDSEFVNIEEADIVIAGGRGVKKRENFAILQDLADSMGGVVGASRNAVDRGWTSYPHQVGLSGKTISPKLYVGLGISGAVQHLAGIKTAEVIIAINSDSEANLMKVADFAIVGDLFRIIPELRKRFPGKEA